MCMYESVVCYGGEKLGEVIVYPQSREGEKFCVKELTITEFSQPSKRCPPLAVLHTITTTSSLVLKMESKSTNVNNYSPLYVLHSLCVHDKKSAVIQFGEDELHLVAMPSQRKGKQHPCFWAFSVASGLYRSSLAMLNIRSLGIVFDLDETLIVANTLRSFEDRIEVLRRKMNTEVDRQRISSMLAELKRYHEDKFILKQYAEFNLIADSGEVFEPQPEVVPALSDNHKPIVRPVIRLYKKNIILTRIDPQIHDTSVLVRLRPAWEGFRRYLTASGRKRFEVYVCTMAERDYALEMWRLLDPEANLIRTEELLDRIVCVKAGLKKSLSNVFKARTCHPKMALIVDDRLNAWDEEDQPRVHVVPAYAPYYAPQAEANISPPVLCVARNVACNVRGSFFKEFDEGLLQRVPDIVYEDDMKDIPFPPDASYYLLPEVSDDAVGTNGTKDPSRFDGMADVEVERRLEVVEEAAAPSIRPSVATNGDPEHAAPIQVAETSSSSFSLAESQDLIIPFTSVQCPQTVPTVGPLNHIRLPEVSLQSFSAREEIEVPESAAESYSGGHFLILQHGHKTRDPLSSEPPLPIKPSLQVPPLRACGSWVPGEEEMSPTPLNRTGMSIFSLESQTMIVQKTPPIYPPLYSKVESSMPSGKFTHGNQRLHKEVLYRDERPSSNLSFSDHQPHPSSGEGLFLSRPVSSSREPDFESPRVDMCPEDPVEVLQGIAKNCGSEVDFRLVLGDSRELQFYVEAWLAGQKIGEGFGKTRREAEYQASKSSLICLSNIYEIFGKRDPGPSEKCVLSILNSSGRQYPHTGEVLSKGSVSALKELCMKEGLSVVFQSSPINYSVVNDEIYVQVEVDGKVLGKGTGLTGDEAVMQAADTALGSLRSMPGSFPQKPLGSPRSVHEMSNKRLRSEFPRYPRNSYPVSQIPDTHLENAGQQTPVAFVSGISQVANASEQSRPDQ